jgi:hypothetical protein
VHHCRAVLRVCAQVRSGGVRSFAGGYSASGALTLAYVDTNGTVCL